MPNNLSYLGPAWLWLAREIIKTRGCLRHGYWLHRGDSSFNRFVFSAYKDAPVPSSLKFGPLGARVQLASGCISAGSAVQPFVNTHSFFLQAAIGTLFLMSLSGRSVGRRTMRLIARARVHRARFFTFTTTRSRRDFVLCFLFCMQSFKLMQRAFKTLIFVCFFD